jgi:hypothetical protein
MNRPKNLPEKYASAKFTYSPVVEVSLRTDRAYVVPKYSDMSAKSKVLAKVVGRWKSQTRLSPVSTTSLFVKS